VSVNWLCRQNFRRTLAATGNWQLATGNWQLAAVTEIPEQVIPETAGKPSLLSRWFKRF